MKHIRILIIIFILLALAMMGLIGRCFYLQYYKCQEFRSQSERAQQTIITEKPCRGLILDSRGRVLAASNRVETLYADRNIITNFDETVTAMEPILRTSADNIANMINESRNPGFIKLAVAIDAAQRAEFLSIKPRPKGISITSDFARQYPASSLAAHVVGFTDFEGNGGSGIELEYNKYLQGKPGKHVFYLDSARRLVRIKEEQSTVENGTGLILTIDETIQEFTRNALYKQWKDYQAESAVAVVMDPYTGAVLAMVSLPDFDPARVGDADRDAWRNRILTDPYEPGSIFKPIVTAIAIDRGVITGNTLINCESGSYSGKGFGTIGEYNSHRYGVLSAKQILVVSSNIGMAKIGQKMGKKKLYDGLKMFGIGSISGIDLPGEGSGVLWPTSRWTGYSITRIPYGQEVSVTALQIARAYCILANGGRPVRPYIVKAIVDPNGAILEYKKPAPPAGQIIKPSVAKWMVQDALVGVVHDEHGTGKNAKLEKWKVFGKTGTANVAMTGQKGFSESEFVASFAGGAPAEKPAVIVLVSIRKPNRKLGKGYTGGTVAAPVVGTILEKTLTYMEQKGMIAPAKSSHDSNESKQQRDGPEQTSD